MFINARPRVVSNANGFETFVPNQRPQHRRLAEMTNSDVNVWGALRARASTGSNVIWDPDLDEFGGDENIPFHTLYSEFYQGAAPALQSQAINYAKAPNYGAIAQTQYQLQHRPSSSFSAQVYQQPVYQLPTRSTDGYPDQSLGYDYVQWNLSRRNGSFAEFTETKNALKENNDRYKASSAISDLTPDSSVSSSQQHTTYCEDYSELNDFGLPSPDTMYNNYPKSTVPISKTYHTVSSPSLKNEWEHETSQGIRYPTPYEVSSHHGLPSAYLQQSSQQYNGSWSSEGSSASRLTAQSQPMDMNTVSPEALRLNVTTPLSSSASSQEGMMSLSLSDAGSYPNTSEDHVDVIGFKGLLVAEEHSLPARRHRQILPDLSPIFTSARTVLNGGSTSSRKAASDNNQNFKKKHRRRRNSSTPDYSARLEEFAQSTEQFRHQPAPMEIEPEPEETVTRHSRTKSPSPQSSSALTASQNRGSKDNFLVRSKLAGMTYREIRKVGGYTEAESTLRGRFRTLTKHKTARVRKPEWDDNDIRLLNKAVYKLNPTGDIAKHKIGWKQVAEYIADHGGSYHFGYATCRKKWDELLANA